jgi:flagellar motor switch protein FliM
MEVFLNAAELDALRAKARRKTSAVRAPGEKPAAAFDPRQAGQPSPGQLQGLELLQARCAQNIAAQLSALLRVPVEAQALAVERLCGADIVEKIPAPACLVSIGGAPGAPSLMQVDLPLVFPILDCLLGGAGEESAETRELTEIEQEILEPVVRCLDQALREGCAPALKLEAQAARTISHDELPAFLPSAESLLIWTFQLGVKETKGGMMLAFPSALSAVLLRQFVPQQPAPPPKLARESGRLRERLLEGRFEAELLLPRSGVSLGQICGLRPGDVVTLSVRASEPLVVSIAGREMFLAAPVRCAARRGAQVLRILSLVPPQEGKEKT